MTEFDPSTMTWLLIFGSSWVVSGLVLVVRRLIAGLVLFAVTIIVLAVMVYQGGFGRF